MLYQHLTDADALTLIVESQMDYNIIPTEGMRKIVKWAVEYFSETSFAIAPSREALMDTWGDDLRSMDIELLPDDEDSDSIHWAIRDLKASYASSQFQRLQHKVTINVAEADNTKKVAEITSAATQMMGLAMSVQEQHEQVSGSLGLRQAMSRRKIRAAQGTSIQGMTLGLDKVDEHIMGIRGGELCIAMGAQGSGKSILAALSLLSNWERGKKAVLFTLENSVQMTYDRIMVAGVNKYYGEEMKAEGHGLMMYEEWERGITRPAHLEYAMKFMDRMDQSDNQIEVIMPDTNSRTPEALVNAARMMDADATIIDQLTFMQYSGPANKPKHEQLGQVLHTLKSLISTGAKPIPCLLLHQMNREGIKAAEKSGKINAYAAADSAEVERTADMLYAIYQTKVQSEANRMSLLNPKLRRGVPKDYLCEWNKGKMMGSAITELDEEEDH